MKLSAKSESNSILRHFNFFLNYLKYIVLSFVVLFAGLILVPVAGVLILGLVFENTGFGSPNDYWVLITLTPTSAHSWLILLSHELAIFWSPVAFIVWTVRDSRKFVAQGVNTRPFLWGIGMVVPLILVFFPLYFIRRNIMWAKEKKKIVLVNEHKKGLVGWWSSTDFVNENTKMKINKGLNMLKWTAVILVGLFGVAVLLGIPFFIENKKTEEQVAKIHATKLTMDDVMGVNLPPDPGAEADKTVTGIDANENGIRDDVELSIFKEYPDSAKTRAVLLQYALALQMEVVQPFENEKNVTEVRREQSRAYDCISQSLAGIEDFNKYINEGDKLYSFIEERQRNTLARKKLREGFVKKIGSYSESDNQVCDIDSSGFTN